MGRNDLWQLPLMERLLRDERLIGERETVFWARKGALCQLLASVLAGPTFVSRKLTLSRSSSGRTGRLLISHRNNFAIQESFVDTVPQQHNRIC